LRATAFEEAEATPEYLNRGGVLSSLKCSERLLCCFHPEFFKYIEHLLTPDLSSPTYNRWNKLDAPESVNTASEEGRRLYVGGLPRFESQEDSDAQIRELFESEGFKPEGM
jgi:hypothetical protein